MKLSRKLIGPDWRQRATSIHGDCHPRTVTARVKSPIDPIRNRFQPHDPELPRIRERTKSEKPLKAEEHGFFVPTDKGKVPSASRGMAGQHRIRRERAVDGCRPTRNS